MLSIEHTEAEGTLLQGTSRGDGSSEVVKSLGWRWGRSIGAWFVPRSRDVAPKRPLIELTAQRLEAAGFEVTVSIDATTGDRVEMEARRVQRSSERVERLTGRAEREQATSDARYAASRELADRIPFGQPILVGHHSEGRARRDRERIGAHMDASVEHQRRADAASEAAHAAAGAARHRHNPVTVGNRIERLGAEIRRGERALARFDLAGGDPESAWRQGATDRLAVARADLAHWEQVRAEQVEAGVAGSYSRDTVTVGDLVKIAGSWRRVARCNAKSVAVETGYSWTDKAPWHTVQDHRPAPHQDAQGGAPSGADPDR